MPAPIAIGISGLLGLAGGYVIDQVFGDGDYTPKEMFVSVGTSMIGGGLLRPVGTALSRGHKVFGAIGDDVYKVGVSLYDDIVVAGYTLAPLASKPVRMEIIGGAALGFVYDHLFSQSSGSSSERNGTHVGPGGTSSGNKMYPLPKDSKGILSRTGRVLHNPCAKGYTPRRIKGRLMCVKE